MNKHFVDLTQPLSLVVGTDEFKSVPLMPWLFANSSGELLSIRRGMVTHLKKTVNTTGYEVINVGTSEKSKSSVAYVHRIVASTWLPAIDGKTHVNHKDSDRTNNHIDNLEWCTSKENAVHSAKSGKMSSTRKPIVGYHQRTGEGKFFDSLMEAEKFGFRQSCLSQCLAGRQLTHMGYVWELYNV